MTNLPQFPMYSYAYKIMALIILQGMVSGLPVLLDTPLLSQ